ncbi:MAG TPA: hypothetical protein P5052_03250 [Candidatus Paceibacterota bacterium]|nr:hypothetical protein [Candidatus Paceibacterota bacterium]
MTLNENMSVTGIHYVAQYNANSSYGTIDVQTKDYSGIADPST